MSISHSDVSRHYYTYCTEFKKSINKFEYCIDSNIVLPNYCKCADWGGGGGVIRGLYLLLKKKIERLKYLKHAFSKYDEKLNNKIKLSTSIFPPAILISFF